MRCEVCRKHKPTRFTIFGKAQGFLVASSWEVAPGHLCDACMKARYESFTRLTVLMGWWGATSFGHALRFVPGNILEYKRARAAPALPVEPTEDELAAEMERKVRRIAAHGAGSRIFYGVAALVLGVVFLGILVANPVEETNGGRVFMAVIGWISTAIGALLLLGGIGSRRAAWHGDIGPLLAGLGAGAGDDGDAEEARPAKRAPPHRSSADAAAREAPRSRRRRR